MPKEVEETRRQCNQIYKCFFVGGGCSRDKIRMGSHDDEYNTHVTWYIHNVMIYNIMSRISSSRLASYICTSYFQHLPWPSFPFAGVPEPKYKINYPFSVLSLSLFSAFTVTYTSLLWLILLQISLCIPAVSSSVVLHLHSSTMIPFYTTNILSISLLLTFTSPLLSSPLLFSQTCSQQHNPFRHCMYLVSDVDASPPIQEQRRHRRTSIPCSPHECRIAILIHHDMLRHSLHAKIWYIASNRYAIKWYTIYETMCNFCRIYEAMCKHAWRVPNENRRCNVIAYCPLTPVTHRNKNTQE